MFSYLRTKLQSHFNKVRAKYSTFSKEQRETTSKTFHALCVASVVGGFMRVLSDNISGNEWEVIIWLPCAILCYVISIKALEAGDDEE